MADRQRVSVSALPNWSTIQNNKEKVSYVDLTQVQNVLRGGINKNYTDIINIINGTTQVANSLKLNGSTLSKYANETLQNDDDKVPSSKQVYQAIEQITIPITDVIKYGPTRPEFTQAGQFWVDTSD